MPKVDVIEASVRGSEPPPAADGEGSAGGQWSRREHPTRQWELWDLIRGLLDSDGLSLAALKEPCDRSIQPSITSSSGSSIALPTNDGPADSSSTIGSESFSCSAPSLWNSHLQWYKLLPHLQVSPRNPPFQTGPFPLNAVVPLIHYGSNLLLFIFSVS